MRKLALKRLTASDLTVFEWHFRNAPAGNQKAINLNAEVFVDRLYPALPEVAVDQGGRLPVDVSIYGPGLAGLDNRQRKIVKLGSYKNWRLDGEYISDPPNEPGRYAVLRPRDMVIFEFFGFPVPSAVKIILLSQAIQEDSDLLERFDLLLGSRRMMEISPTQVYEVVSAASPSDEHPVYELLLDAVVEDAALGGGRALRGFARPGRRLSREDLQRTRKNLEEIGRLGEELVGRFLESQLSSGEIDSYVWVSEAHAVAPYDFEVAQMGARIRVDAKSTAGEFDRPLHISIAELYAMAEENCRYDLYRVFELNSDGAILRIARDVGPFAREVLNSLSGLPATVQVDSVSVLPSTLNFGRQMKLSFGRLDDLASVADDEDAFEG